ncbi:UDP-N-acetylmuramate dehydrogenase [Chitinivorax sp. PXF-14]|uniref:UDP-N-acetylmuramate dehydrogenase n=1 Tax=Chitinivorax sp. PXF-14 TaxID=3230488 RepID=UPI0034651B84
MTPFALEPPLSQPLIESNVSLKPFNTFGVDVQAAGLAHLASLDELRAVLADPAWQGVPRLVLGGGSNMLFTRDFPGLVLRVELQGRTKVDEDAQAVYARGMAGESWHDFVQWTIAQGWAGLENLSLIPGTVGASPIQNIGAYGVEIKDCFHSLDAIELATGQLRQFLLADCAFAYRDSVFKGALAGRYLVVSVTFRLPKQPCWHTGYGEIQQELATRQVTELSARAIADAVIAIRRRKLPDPAEIGNAGSFFKNPVVEASLAAALRERFPALPAYPQPDGRSKLAAGWLIDQCGWKGRSLGAAGVYEKQALVLVNCGGASGADIWRLAEAIRASVYERFGVELEPEPVRC